MHTYTYTHIHMYVHTHTYVCTLTHRYGCTHKHTHTCAHVCMQNPFHPGCLHFICLQAVSDSLLTKVPVTAHLSAVMPANTPLTEQRRRLRLGGREHLGTCTPPTPTLRILFCPLPLLKLRLPKAGGFHAVPFDCSQWLKGTVHGMTGDVTSGSSTACAALELTV